ncbi:MAG: prepilin-type N-terminal cleavage/methylation domain-containing protein [Gemmatimonadetes bacterium]|nr:prepilin-type N-terminal cleavage/methylation domain-containing protein [Gemmatimonadota bacterium]
MTTTLMNPPEARRCEVPGNAGFSLIELMVSITMMGMLMLGFMSVFPLGLRTVMKGERMTVATSIGQDELERLKTLPDTDADLAAGAHVDPANPIQGVFSRVWTVTDDAPMAGLKTVVMTVTYTENGLPRTITLTTYLAS